MRKLFVSVPAKLLILVVSALMILSAGISVMSISRLNNEFKLFQIEKVKQSTSQLDLHTGIAREKLSLWIESFADVIQLHEQDTFYELANAVERQLDSIQLSHNVENVWLFDENNEAIFRTVKATDYARFAAKQVLIKQEPYHQLYCEQSCEQLIAVPLLNRKGELAVIVMTMSLVDVIYSINQSLNSEVAVASLAKSSLIHVADIQFLSASNTQLMRQLVTVIEKDILVDEVINMGLQVDIT